MITRRIFNRGCLTLAAAAAVPWRAANSDDARPLIERIDEALAAATRFLESRQQADGAWRSQTYGPLKDGPSLTSFIAATLACGPADVACGGMLDRAANYLAALAPTNGSTDRRAEPMSYSVYAAAGAIVTLTKHQPHANESARDAWLKLLRSLQLTEACGWSPADSSYGGWSYAPTTPHPVEGKPPTPLAVPNLSATVFALDALRAAALPARDAAIGQARVFVERCQNWPKASDEREPAFDDGGFFFVLDDTVRNKAGEFGVDKNGRVRFASYGSATADGLRALIACGVESNQPRAAAARRCLETQFTDQSHPGRYAPDREFLRPAVQYYYWASLAQALSVCQEQSVCDSPPGWAPALAASILSRQQTDGTWVNPVVDVREDDPLVATPLAMRALMHCRGCQ